MLDRSVAIACLSPAAFETSEVEATHELFVEGLRLNRNAAYKDIRVRIAGDPGQSANMTYCMTRGVENIVRPVAKVIKSLKTTDSLL